MFSENKNFYPTPPHLISKMLGKIQGKPRRILEPSAGKGDLVNGILNSHKFSQYNKPDVFCIEIDPVLQATLRGLGHKVIDSDFLAYSGPDKFCAIVANPPFDDGDKHLHKALDIMYRGQIICLLNAETLRNPHTNSRKRLVRRLTDLGADIEYITDAFTTAERRTDVEIALVYVNIKRNVDDELFGGCDDHAARPYQTVTDNHQISTGKTISELVADYNDIIQTGQETIWAYYRNIRKIGNYLTLGQADCRDNARYLSSADLTAKMQDALNTLLADVRKTYWRKTLDLEEARARLTTKKAAEFEIVMQDRCHMDFTESNIRQFVLNLIGGYEQTLIDAAVDLFDRFTIRHTWSKDNRYEQNIHYFSGWKTNQAFKVGKRVIIPVPSSYGEPFTSYGKWQLNDQAAENLRDIDVCMSYFDGMKDSVSLVYGIKAAFANNENSGESTYFKFICHKKGTIHLTFKDEDVLRRFNVVACRGKGWLPGDFGARAYNELTALEQAVVDSFDGVGGETYDKYVSQSMFKIAAKEILRLNPPKGQMLL